MQIYENKVVTPYRFCRNHAKLTEIKAKRGRMAHLSPTDGALPEIFNLVVPPLFLKQLHFAWQRILWALGYPLLWDYLFPTVIMITR